MFQQLYENTLLSTWHIYDNDDKLIIHVLYVNFRFRAHTPVSRCHCHEMKHVNAHALLSFICTFRDVICELQSLCTRTAIRFVALIRLKNFTNLTTTLTLKRLSYPPRRIPYSAIKQQHLNSFFTICEPNVHLQTKSSHRDCLCSDNFGIQLLALVEATFLRMAF